jgi:hypothetical protein
LPAAFFCFSRLRTGLSYSLSRLRPKKKTQFDPREPRKHHLSAAVALFVLTLAAFSSSFQAGFAWDSQYLILQDPRIRAATSENIGLIFQHSYWWPTGEAGLYRPLTTLSYLFNYGVLGQREAPAGYHWINFALHYINVVLVYAAALRLVRRFWPSVFMAAIWGGASGADGIGLQHRGAIGPARGHGHIGRIAAVPEKRRGDGEAQDRLARRADGGHAPWASIRRKVR